MDLGEDESFDFKHPYFFDNYTFKFENLNGELKENFETIVKRLGATVSNESQYIFTDFASTSLDRKRNYYSLGFLSNSILAEEPLEIEEYKYSKLVQDENESGFCNCSIGRYILKTKSCVSYVSQNFCCKSCIEKRGLLKKMKNQCSNQDDGSYNLPLVQDKLDNLSSNENSNEDHIGDENHNASVQSPMNGTSYGNEMNVSFSDAHVGGENHNTSNQSLTNSIPQENEVNENHRNSSDLEMMQIQTHVNLEEPSCSMQHSKKPKTNKPSSIDRWRRVPLAQNKIDHFNAAENSSDAHIGGENHNASIQSLTNDTSDNNDMSNSSSDAHVGGENHNASDQSSTNSIPQENEENENDRNSSDSEIIEVQSNDNVEEPSCSTQHSKKQKTSKPSSIDGWKRKRTPSSSSDTRNKASDTRDPTREKKNKRQRLASSPSVETTREKPSVTPKKNGGFGRRPTPQEQICIEKIDADMNKDDWWAFLPPPNKYPRYTVRATKTRGRGRDYSIGENKLMLAYLIENDEIDDATSRRPWKEMVHAGYMMADRTEESLNNHYRKFLLPDIESFMLPAHIERKFIENRDLHTNIQRG